MTDEEREKALRQHAQHGASLDRWWASLRDELYPGGESSDRAVAIWCKMKAPDFDIDDVSIREMDLLRRLSQLAMNEMTYRIRGLELFASGERDGGDGGESGASDASKE